MAQESQTVGTNGAPELWAANRSVSVPAAGNTRILDLVTQSVERVMVHIDVATQALDGFRVLAKASRDASYDLLYSTSGHYTSPTGLLVGASGDLTALAAGASGWLLVDVRGVYALAIEVSAAAGTASVSAFVGGS